LLKGLDYKIRYVEEVTSTNDVVKNLAKEDEEQGLVLVAKRQTRGRGRQGKVWSSSDDFGLWFSILLKPNMRSFPIQTLTLVLAIAMAETIKKVSHIQCGIKWPNDLTHEGKKLCGILCESGFSGHQLDFIVAGIGLNVNQENFKNGLKDIAGSLRMFQNRVFNKDEILQTFLALFNQHYITLLDQGLKGLMDCYRGYSTVIGKRVQLIEGKEETFVKVLDVNDLGCLVVLHEDGHLKEVCSGEVTLREVQ
jgi:BirA family biotin operon repressor/biotin-[acetyl-CoA-carboxylase] ligase